MQDFYSKKKKKMTVRLLQKHNREKHSARSLPGYASETMLTYDMMIPRVFLPKELESLRE